VTIRSKLPTKEYQEGWDRIFSDRARKKLMEQAKKQSDHEPSWDEDNDVKGTVTQVWHEGE